MRKIALSINSIPNEDIDQLADWLKTYPRLSSGPLVIEFEKKLAQKVGSKHAVFVNSGSSANLLMLYSLKAMDMLKNDRVVVPSLAWSTTLGPVMQLGMKPILCDINFNDLSVDLFELEKIFKQSNPSCFILVSVLGMSPKMKEIKRLCDSYDVILLEDACESLGSTSAEKHIGTFGLMGSYSFFYSHQFCTVEGGAIVTDDDHVYQGLLMMREHGWTRKCDREVHDSLKDKWKVDDFNDMYTFYLPGFNFRNTEISAFLGLKQMDRFEEQVKIRDKNFRLFNENLKNDNWKPNTNIADIISNLGYPVIHHERPSIIKALIENDVECRPLISGCMGTQPFFIREYGKQETDNSKILNEYGFYIPNNPDLTEEEILRMCKIINDIINA